MRVWLMATTMAPVVAAVVFLAACGSQDSTSEDRERAECITAYTEYMTWKNMCRKTGCIMGELWTCDAVACKIMRARMDYYYDLCR